MKTYITHLHAQEVSNKAHAAHWNNERCQSSYLTKEARDDLVQLLAGEPAGTDARGCRAALVDRISAAIVNSNDLDATPESQAEAILEDILNNCLPMPAEVSS